MDEWEALEEAMRQEQWSEAAAGARALLDAWQEVKRALLWFVNEEVEREAERFESALSTLVALLEREPVDAQAVDAVREQVRMFVGQGSP